MDSGHNITLIKKINIREMLQTRATKNYYSITAWPSFYGVKFYNLQTPRFIVRKNHESHALRTNNDFLIRMQLILDKNIRSEDGVVGKRHSQEHAFFYQDKISWYHLTVFFQDFFLWNLLLSSPPPFFDGLLQVLHVQRSSKRCRIQERI